MVGGVLSTGTDKVLVNLRPLRGCVVVYDSPLNALESRGNALQRVCGQAIHLVLVDVHASSLQVPDHVCDQELRVPRGVDVRQIPVDLAQSLDGNPGVLRRQASRTLHGKGDARIIDLYVDLLTALFDHKDVVTHCHVGVNASADNAVLQDADRGLLSHNSCIA